MRSKVRVSECGTWVQTRVGGTITFESALEFIAEAARKASVHRLDSYLFDLREASNAKRPFHDFEIAHHRLRALGFSSVSRVALLVNPNDQTHDFFKLTAGNAGHNWRIFNDENGAMDWLRRPEPSQVSSELTQHRNARS